MLATGDEASLLESPGTWATHADMRKPLKKVSDQIIP